MSDELILSLNYGPAENAILNRLLWNKSCGLIDTQLALTVNTVNVFFRQDYSVYPSRQTTLFPYLTRIMTSALYTDWPFDCPVDKLLFALRDLANFSNTYDTYSIVSKSPLGHDQWNSYYGANKILFGAKSRLAIQPQLSSHMYIDRCLIAAYRYLRKGIACNGGINSVHLWPSGKITACPYDTDGLTMVDGDTVAQQIRNMHQAPSPITHCHLPDLLDKVLRNEPSYEEVLKQYEYQ